MTVADNALALQWLSWVEKIWHYDWLRLSDMGKMLSHQDIDNDSVDKDDDNITWWIESADQCKATSRQIWTNSLNYTE